MKYKAIFTFSFLCLFLNTFAAGAEEGDELTIRVPLRVCKEIEYWNGVDKLSVRSFYAKNDGDANLVSTCDKGFGVWDASKKHIGVMPLSFAELKYDMSVVKTEESNPGLRGTRWNSFSDSSEYDATKLTYTKSPIDLVLKAGWRAHMPKEGRFVIFGVKSVFYHQGKVENESWHTGFVVLDVETDQLISRIKPGLAHGRKARLEKVIGSLTGSSLKQ